MSTSGVKTWTQFRNQIITLALGDVGAVEEGDSPRPELISSAAETLNALINSWSGRGHLPWLCEWTTQTFSAPSEVTGTDGSIYTCIKGHTSAAGNRPVTGADYSSHWKLRGSTGGSWLTSTAYTSANEFTPSTGIIGIDRAFIRYSGTDSPLRIIDREEYSLIYDKAQQGEPGRIWLDRGSSLTPKAYLDLHVNDTDMVLHYFAVYRPDDMRTSYDTAEFPDYALRALRFGLARDLSPRYLSGKDNYALRLADIKALADEAYRDMRKGGAERPDSRFIRSAY